MKIPRDVSGLHLADVLCRRWRYTLVHQVGSHMILETSDPAKQRISIPDHHPLRLGTLGSILRRSPSTKVCRAMRSSQVCKEPETNRPFLVRQLAGQSQGRESGGVENLVRVRVPDPADDAGIRQCPLQSPVLTNQRRAEACQIGRENLYASRVLRGPRGQASNAGGR